MSYGPDPEHVKIWVEGEPFPEDLAAHIEAGGILTAWNAQFEWAIWNLCCVHKYGWKPLPISQVRCSMVRAYAMALPGALEDAAPALGVDQRKDPEGHRIMLQLSKPKKDGSLWRRDNESLDKFLKLYDYNKQDVRTELACLDRLMELSPGECALWELDHKINNRGVMCDLASVDKAIAIIQSEQKRLNAEMLKVTGGVVGSCNEVQMLGKWIKLARRSDGWPGQGGCAECAGMEWRKKSSCSEDSGVEFTLPTEIPALPPAVRRALELRQEAAKSSTAKLVAMRRESIQRRPYSQYASVSCGVYRAVGRPRSPAAKFVPRAEPGVKQEDIEAMFSMLDDKEMLDLFYGPSMAAVSDCIRGMLIAGEGNELVACDFSAIEARALPWLAGQESCLKYSAPTERFTSTLQQVFTTCLMEEVTKDQSQRGKVAILGLGYGGLASAPFRRWPKTTMSRFRTKKLRKSKKRGAQPIER